MHNFSHQHLLYFYFTKETKNNIFLENQNPNESNDKNEVNKLNDICEVKFLSNNQNKKYIRHRPPSNPQWTPNKSKFIEMEQEWGQWGEKRLLQYDKYLSTDATTHEGRQFIAKVNKVEQQWNKMEESKKENIINTQDRIYALLILVRKEGSGVTINFGPEEGLHRTLGAFMAVTGRYINPLEGVCNDKIRLDHLSNIIITPSATNDSIEDVQSVINLALSDSSENVMGTGIVEELKQTPYIRQPANVMVRWMSVYPFTKSSYDICKKLRQNSRATSDGKLQSVKISGEANIGIFVNQMIVTMLQNPKVFQSKLDHIPNTSTLQPLQYKITRTKGTKGNETIEKATEKEFWRPTPWQNIQNSKNDKKLCDEYKERKANLAEIENETIISGIIQLSFDERYLNYVSDPFDEEKDRACRSDLLRFRSTTDKNVSCEPPFINSHDSLTDGDLSYVTTWTLNAMWVIPKFIYYLLADKKHETLNNIVRDAEKSELAKQLSLYTVRYHANCYGVNNMKAHGAMKHIYDAITWDEYLIDNENIIIASALFFSDLCNVALTNPNEWSEKESDEDTRVKSVVEGKKDGEDSESLSSATESSSENEYDDDDDDSDVDTVDQEDIDAFSKNGKDFESMLTQLRNKSPCTIEAVIKTTGTLWFRN